MALGKHMTFSFKPGLIRVNKDGRGGGSRLGGGGERGLSWDRKSGEEH